MPSKRTVAVLGPIPRDHITTHHGETFDKYGCALYTVAALSALMEPTDRICPVVHVQRQDEEAIKEQLAQFSNVDITGINLEEAGCSWFPDRTQAGATGNPMTTDEMPVFAEHCLRSGVKAVCITLDEEGCVVYHLDDAGDVAEETIGRIHVENVV